jgi:hypothetical protein
MIQKRHCNMEIEFTTNPITLGEMIDLQRSVQGDIESFAKFLTSRSNLSLDQVLKLDTTDLEEIGTKLSESLKSLDILGKLGKQFPDLDISKN